jgi:hypothetical protein
VALLESNVSYGYASGWKIVQKVLEIHMNFYEALGLTQVLVIEDA